MKQQPNLARLVVFTPMPPRPNGIADYSYELLAGLAREFDCTVVVEDGTGNSLAPPGVTVISETEYRLHNCAFASPLHIYQLGNNHDHVYILPYLQMHPGLVVLHDLTLHYLLDRVSVGAGNMSRYVDAMEAEHGVAGRILGEQFERFRLRDNNMFFDMPMIAGIARASKGIIVHSKYGAVKVKARCPSASVTVVPHQYSPPSADEVEDPREVRYELGVGESELLFMSLGFVAKAKRIDSAIRTLAAIRHRLPPFKYVIAGELRPQEVDILGLATSLGIRDRLVTPGYVSERRFFSLLQAADVVINLRHPIGGETSGTMIRALGAGACVVVVDRGPFAEIPLGAAMPVRWGPGFEQRLTDALLRLGTNPDLRQQIGQRARSVTTTGNSLEATVAGYKRAITAAQAAKAPACSPRRSWSFLPQRRLNHLVAGANRSLGKDLPVWFTGGMVPVCDGSATRAVVVGAGPSELALLELLGHAESVEPYGNEEGPADLIICFSDTTEIAGEEGAIATQFNRRLAFGGMLVWSITRRTEAGATSDLEQRQRGLRLLQSYGFRVDMTNAWSEPLIDDDRDLAATEIVEQRAWRAYKISETFAGPQFWPDMQSGVQPVDLSLRQV